MRQEEIQDGGSSPLEAVLIEELKESVRQSVRELCLKQQTCLQLHYWEQLKLKEIAAITNLPIGTVKFHMHKGREKIRERIEQYHSGDLA